MFVYLPVADLAVNAMLIIAIGAAVGFLSGMFGVGGGFLMTPLLVFAGVPFAVAVASGANPLIAASITGTIAQYKRRNVDLKLGYYLLGGGAVGALAGVLIIKALRAIGQIDLTVSILYVIFMGVVGGLMLLESLRAIYKIRNGKRGPVRNSSKHTWVHGLPLKTRFPASKLYISTIPPIVLGVVVGILAGVMGVGGGFIMVPVLIYVLRVPTNVAIGTSLFQIIFVSALTTIFHATFNHTVDVLLALLLMIGGVVGAQIGSVAGQKLKAEQLRLLLALLVLAVGIRISADMLSYPKEPFSLTSSET